MIFGYLIRGIEIILNIYLIIMVIGIILTWIPSAYEYKIPRMIRNMTDWYLGYFRGIFVLGSIDFTTIFGILLYEGILELLILIM